MIVYPSIFLCNFKTSIYNDAGNKGDCRDVSEFETFVKW